MPLTLVPPRKGYSKNWRIRGTVAGIPINESTRVADRKLAEAVRIQRENQLLQEAVFGARASRSFAQAAVAYVETVKPTGTQRDAILGRVRNDGLVSPCLLEDFGNMLVNAVDQAAADDVRSRRYSQASAATVQRQFLTPLIAVLNFAAHRKWCDRPRLWRPKSTRGRTRWASYQEADRLVVNASLHHRPLYVFLMLTGARMSEALEIEWHDVDLGQRWLVFRDTKRDKRGPDHPGEDRGVPIHPQLVLWLANLPGERQGRVFLTPRGKPYGGKQRGYGGQIKTAWKGACRRAGIADLHPHDLRHTCSTWLTMAGVHEQVRDEIIGHASTSMGRRYSHVPRPELIEAINRLPMVAAGLEFADADVATRAKSV